MVVDLIGAGFLVTAGFLVSPVYGCLAIGLLAFARRIQLFLLLMRYQTLAEAYVVDQKGKPE